jgi:hypothetical protein
LRYRGHRRGYDPRDGHAVTMATRRPPRYVPRDSSSRRVWIYIAVAVFVLADIILILWALTSNRADATSARPARAVVETAPPVVEHVETTSPTPQPLATDTPVTPVASTRILAALDATTAWRATTGACPDTAAAPELTTNGGVTWKTTDATEPAKVTALQSIMVSSAKVASMVGLAQAGCAPQFVKTFIAGDNYASYPKELDSAWYVDPANRARVHSPAGDQSAPCDAVVTLAPRDAEAAAVLCANGGVYATSDGAASWSPPATVSGAISLTATESGYLAAVAGRAACAGVQVLSITNDLASAPGPAGCFPVVEPAETLSENVAMSAAHATIWLWAGNMLVRSSDSGSTWR